MGSLRWGFQPPWGHMNVFSTKAPPPGLTAQWETLGSNAMCPASGPRTEMGKGGCFCLYIYIYIYIYCIYQIHIWVVISNIFYFQIFFNYLGKIRIWSGRFTIFDNRLHSCAAIYWDLLPDFEHSDSYFSKGLKPYSIYSYIIWLASREWDNESPLIM